MGKLFVSYNFRAVVEGLVKDIDDRTVSGFGNTFLEYETPPQDSKSLEDLTSTIDKLVAVRNKFKEVECVILYFRKV